MHILRLKLKKFLPVLMMSQFFLFLNSYNAFPGSTASLSGRIISSETQRPLKGANVVIKDTDLGAATDDSGYYSIRSIPAGFYTIQISHIGYQSHEANVHLNQDANKRLDFELIPTIVKLNSVEIEAERLWDKYVTDVSLVGVQRMKPDQIVTIPGAFDDPARAVQIMSGVSGGGDFSSFLAVRDGSPDQNLVVMDGVVIPNPYRFRLAMGGGLSIFDPNIIGDVHLHLGGYSAEFGNGLSSVLEIGTRHVETEKIKLRGSMNLLDAGGVVEGPLPYKKGSWLISARRTYVDWIANEFVSSNSVFPYSYDINGKLTYQISPKNLLSIRWMKNREGARLFSELADDINLTEESNTNFLSLIWQSNLSQAVQVQSIFAGYTDKIDYHSYSSDETRANPDYERMKSKAKNLYFKENIRWQASESSSLLSGIEWQIKDSKVSFNSQDRNFYYARNDIPNSLRFDDSDHYVACFLEHTSKITEYLQLRTGLRYNYSSLIKQSTLSPRINILYKINEKTTLQSSWGVCHQYPNPLAVFTRDQPLDFSATLENIAAEKATHHVVEIKRDISKNYDLKTAFYYIDFDRLLMPVDNENLTATNTGLGISKGIEVVLTRKHSKISGLVSYSYCKAQYRNINSNKWTSFKYERRHGLTLWGTYKISNKIQLSMLWRVASGLPYTPIPGVRIKQISTTEYSWDFIRGEKNSEHFPVYQRLDLRLTWSHKYFSLYLDLINVYNYANIYEMTWEKDELEQQGKSTSIAKRRTIYMLPFLPSIGMSFKL